MVTLILVTSKHFGDKVSIYFNNFDTPQPYKGKTQSPKYIHMKREVLLKKICDHLGYIAHQVEVRNAIRMYDINIVAEDFYKELLNLVYSLNLVNLNTEERNTTAIDLGDKEARFAVQVTSTNSIDKIRDTTQKFTKSGREADYDCLLLLILKRKKSYRKLPEPSQFELQVKDYLDLIKDIHTNCAEVSHLESIATFLNNELYNGLSLSAETIRSSSKSNAYQASCNYSYDANGSILSSFPSLIIPSNDYSTSELKNLFGQNNGQVLMDLSFKAINAIADGEFNKYVMVGQEFERMGNTIGIPGLVAEGVLLSADGHRLLSGQNKYEQLSLIQLARDEFELAKEITNGDPRSTRGLACCDLSEFNYGSALEILNKAVEEMRTIIALGSIEKLQNSRRLGDMHELLRLVRHRIETVLRIKKSSSQSRWNSEVGIHDLAHLVDEHERLFSSTLGQLKANHNWYHFECFASSNFLSEAWSELGNQPKARDYALSALKHRRVTMNESLSNIQLDNLKWWLSANQRSLLEWPELIECSERLAHAIQERRNNQVLEEVDYILSTKK